MHIKVPIEDNDSSTLPLFFDILEQHQSSEMIIDFLVSWLPDPDRDDLLESWIADHRFNFKDLLITYFTHSKLLEKAMFFDDVEYHYEVDITTMSMLKIMHPKKCQCQ